MAIRTAFPEAGSQYQGGTSDGWEYRVLFTGTRSADVYAMIRTFLEEEGYADLPLPATAQELKLFKKPRIAQPGLFEYPGYIHNPIKILFLPSQSRRITIGLFIYNETAEGHLARFHGVV